MTSLIESFNCTKHTPLYGNEQKGREIIQWRLLDPALFEPNKILKVQNIVNRMENNCYSFNCPLLAWRHLWMTPYWIVLLQVKDLLKVLKEAKQEIPIELLELQESNFGSGSSKGRPRSNSYSSGGSQNQNRYNKSYTFQDRQRRYSNNWEE